MFLFFFLYHQSVLIYCLSDCDYNVCTYDAHVIFTDILQEYTEGAMHNHLLHHQVQ